MDVAREETLKHEWSKKEGNNNRNLSACNEKQLQKRKDNKHVSEENSQGHVPIQEQVLKKLKRERRFLKKWTVELNQVKSDINGTTAEEFASMNSKIAEIQKRYRILLPAIKLAMETVEAACSKDHLEHVGSVTNSAQRGIDLDMIQESDEKGRTDQGPAGRFRWLRESKHTSLVTPKHSHIEEKPACDPKSVGSLMTDFSKYQLTMQRRYLQSSLSAYDLDHLKADSAKEHRQSIKQMNLKHDDKSRIYLCEPGAGGEIINNKNNLANHTKPSFYVNGAAGCISESPLSKPADENISNEGHVVQRGVKESTTLALRQAMPIKTRCIDNFRKAEQNLLCSGTNEKSYFSSSNSADQRSTTSLAASTRAITYSSEKCKCKNKRYNLPCICKCSCVEEIDISDLRSESYTSSAPSGTLSSASSKPPKGKPGLGPKALESIEVQTSFPNSIGPCSPENCPYRKRKRVVENRCIEVQTDDTDIEWQYQPPLLVKKDKPRVCKEVQKPKEPMKYAVMKKSAVCSSTVPTKRTQTMDDRLLRRIFYFDNHKASVCNKNVEFCTYNVHQTKNRSLKTGEKPCDDCPGSRKCDSVLEGRPYRLSCSEVVVEVKSLELNQEGVDSLKKVCCYLYIDYVFLGHVGNETNLAPVSDRVFFDSRKSYSVSLRFNKKERSILREQVNPSGLLVKDSVMFIVVCQAAPEFDIHKNWDFGFGYLSMKRIGEQIGTNDKISTTIEMQKIGGTKNNIGNLVVAIEGLQTIKRVMSEELNCIEPQVDILMDRLMLHKKKRNSPVDKVAECKRHSKCGSRNMEHQEEEPSKNSTKKHCRLHTHMADKKHHKLEKKTKK